MSRRRPGVFWVHNDSGGAPQLFALSSSGRHLATYDVVGAEARDWEDLDIGREPGGDRDYIYVGDIGDNELRFESVAIYRVEEPEVDPSFRGATKTTSRVKTLRLRYPDGPHDAEALFVDPRTGALVIVTKERSGPSQVFRVAAESFGSKEIMPERIAEVSLPGSVLPGGRLITAGTMSSDGRWVLMKTYTSAYLWERGDGRLEESFRRSPCRVPVALEPQGEAVAFVGEGLDYVTLSEGAQQPLYVFTEVDGDDSTDP